MSRATERSSPSSGDFFGSPAALFEEKAPLLPAIWQANNVGKIRRIFDEELAWIDEQRPGPTVGYPDHNVALAWHAKSYVELALDNIDHFGWHDLVAYCRSHAAALELAREAYRTGSASKRREAIYYNRFADHFLTDGFAAGHIRALAILQQRPQPTRIKEVKRVAGLRPIFAVPGCKARDSIRVAREQCHG